MGTNIFGNDDKKNLEFHEKIDTHSRAILNVVERQKDIESSLDLLNEKIELLDHNSIKNFKDISMDFKSIREDIKNLKEELSFIKENSTKITKQLKLIPYKDEILKLEKYIDLWNPMNFVTREELSEKKDEIITKNDLKKFEKNLKKEITEQISKIIENFIKD